MSIIEDPILTVENLSAETVRVRVRYTMVQHPLEFWANTLYREEIFLLDGQIPFSPELASGTDLSLVVFPSLSVKNPRAPEPPPEFAFNRERVLIVAKKALDEDPDLREQGIRFGNKMYAMIRLTYLADVPYPFNVGSKTAILACSDTVTCLWRKRVAARCAESV